eukprot:1193407-Prorocentrum_minimum.AAC.3
MNEINKIKQKKIKNPFRIGRPQHQSAPASSRALYKVYSEFVRQQGQRLLCDASVTQCDVSVTHRGRGSASAVWRKCDVQLVQRGELGDGRGEAAHALPRDAVARQLQRTDAQKAPRRPRLPEHFLHLGVGEVALVEVEVDGASRGGGHVLERCRHQPRAHLKN